LSHTRLDKWTLTCRRNINQAKMVNKEHHKKFSAKHYTIISFINATLIFQGISMAKEPTV
jgi:hypothetical protein